MKVHILVEGPSERALLEVWGRRFLPRHTIQVHPHEGRGRLTTDPGKQPDPRHRGLLDQLPAKLRAYGRTLDPAVERVLVLVDADETDCVDLKGRLVSMLQQIDPKPEVLFRIAVAETEAFYLGDMSAIKSAFGAARPSRARIYVQDSSVPTWEIFRDVIGAVGENKVQWAEKIAPHLTTVPSANKSPSFRHLCAALRRLAGEGQ